MRITGGKYRSRPLVAPKGARTRPTSDRVREALFSILLSERGTPSLAGERVLDLYAGTGALGFEALSRGAEHVTFVEEARDALAALRSNAAALGVLPSCRILAMSVERAERLLMQVAEGERFSLVFADPPYKLVPSGELARAMEPLARSSAFAADATVVIEHASADPAPDLKGLEPLESRRYGDTMVSLYRSRI